MSIPAIQHDLSSPEGFASRVKVPNGLLVGAYTSLGFGVAFLAYNFFLAREAFGQPWFWEYFMSTEVTGSGTARVWIYVYVYGPFVLIPLGIILLIIALATRKGATAGTFEAYQARGFVAAQQPAGFALPLGDRGEEQPLSLIAAPGVTAEQFAAAVQGVYARVASLDKKSAKELAKAAKQHGIAAGGVKLSALFPELQGEILLAPTVGTQSIVAVIPGEQGLGLGKGRILEIKN